MVLNEKVVVLIESDVTRGTHVNLYGRIGRLLCERVAIEPQLLELSFREVSIVSIVSDNHLIRTIKSDTDWRTRLIDRPIRAVAHVIKARSIENLSGL